MWLLFGFGTLISSAICFLVFIVLMVELFKESPPVFFLFMAFLVWVGRMIYRSARDSVRQRRALSASAAPPRHWRDAP